MEQVNTLEINGEEREIADAVAREQIATNAQNIAKNAEGIAGLNDSLSVIGKCKNLLNPTLATTKLNGVTCTANSDGTYTLNGTATEQTLFGIESTVKYPSGTYKLVGCPIGGSSTTYSMIMSPSNGMNYYDYGIGVTRTTTIEDIIFVGILVESGQTLNNVTFKPMLTEDLSSTYDDFVPYTGDGETLTHDVSVLKSDLSDCCKKSDITTNETLIGTFNGKNYYRRLFTGIGASGSSVTVNVGEKIEIYNYYGRAYTYGQSGASDVKYPIPNKNYYIDSQNASETSFQLTIPTSSDTRKIDLVIEYTKVDE